MWLPPGGHIEADELPDEAALREVREETGLRITLLGNSGLSIREPRQLLTPEGIQVERIGNAAEEHEHIDLIYYAVPSVDWDDVTGLSSEGVTKQLLFSADEVEEGGWFEREELFRMDLAEDVRLWSIKALREVPARVAVLRQKGTSNKG
jgi:8-oxo-dGTP pyrophosphatase MutT (NUDIX family)